MKYPLFILCTILAGTASAAPDDARTKAILLGRSMHSGPEQAVKAAESLAAMGSAAEPAAKDLVYALSYDDPDVAVAISSAIVAIGAKAVPPLKDALLDPNFCVRRRSADVLGRIGPAAASAAGALVEALSDPQYDVHMAAERALVTIGPGVIPDLTRVYPKSDEPTRRRLIQIMGRLGPDAVPHLVQMAKKDPSGFVRLSAVEELSQMTPFPAHALGAIESRLSDMDESVRGGTVDALGT